MSNRARFGPDPEERTLDVERRFRRSRAIGVVAILVALLGSTPWLGWSPLVPYCVGGLALGLSDRLAYGSRRPQVVICAGIVMTDLAVASGTALSGGVSSPVLVLLVMPVFMVSIRYQGWALMVGVAGCFITVIVTCVFADTDAFAANPSPMFFLLAAMIGLGSVTEMTQRTETYHRAKAVIDPLTGLFNRSSLAQRFDELQQQSRLTDQYLSAVVCDLDYFKRVNDEHGHAQGDAVLKDIAYTMRKVLRHGDLAYRIGGEEFVILLPGLAADPAAEVAERLRAAIAESDPAGIPMTMSFGVATWEPEHRDWAQLYRMADARLYEAKKTGRNCVVGERLPSAA